MEDFPPLIDPDFKEFFDTMKSEMIKPAFLKSDEKFKQSLIDLTYSERRAEIDDNQYLVEIINIARVNSFEAMVNFSFELFVHYHHWLIAKLEFENDLQTTDQDAE